MFREMDESTLCFDRYQPAAGHPDWAKLAEEATTLVRELRPSLATPRRREVRRRRYAAYATAARNYVENRRRHKQGREDLLPLYFIWTVLRSCNFRCTYCDDHQGRKYPDLPTDGTLDTDEGLRLLEVMRTRTPAVYFAGGEPTARKDLPTLVRRAAELKYYPIVVNTNGDPELLDALAFITLSADLDPAPPGWMERVRTELANARRRAQALLDRLF